MRKEPGLEAKNTQREAFTMVVVCDGAEPLNCDTTDTYSSTTSRSIRRRKNCRDRTFIDEVLLNRV